jgi:hypothetical protein
LRIVETLTIVRRCEGLLDDVIALREINARAIELQSALSALKQSGEFATETGPDNPWPAATDSQPLDVVEQRNRIQAQNLRSQCQHRCVLCQAQTRHHLFPTTGGRFG